MSESQMGGGAVPTDVTRSEIRLVTRALRECWLIPEEARSRAITQVQNIIENCDHPRYQIAATRVIMGASKHNLEAIRVAMAAEHHEDFTGRLEKIEQRMNVEGESQGGADGSLA
jgi:hypothetical protein